MSNKIVGTYRVTTPKVINSIRLGDMNRQPLDCYEVKITFMEGDADGYQYKTIRFKNDGKQTDHMIEFLNFLARCSVAYPNGKGGYDGFDHVDGYEKFVDWEFCDTDYDYDPKYTQLMNWPRFYDGDCSTDFECAEVFYYNPQGVKFKVELV